MIHNQQDIKEKQNIGTISPVNEFLWGFIGLILTILGTFIEAFIAIPVFNNSESLIPMGLGVTYQIVGVLLAGCMGGQNAAVYAQIAYVVLGLFKLPIFAQGGGFDYLQQPSFGYILGFIPGGWLCGYLSLPGRRKLENLALCALLGLIVIHLCGIIYLIGFTFISPIFGNELASNYLSETIHLYSIQTIPAHLIMVCLVAFVSYILRLILFY